MSPSKTPLVRLAHIRDEIDQLNDAFKGVSLAQFLESYVLRRTAEHAILIVSEATKALPAALTVDYPYIDWRAICDIGNLLRHAYFEVDPNVIWRVVKERLPELRAVVDQMIQRDR